MRMLALIFSLLVASSAYGNDMEFMQAVIQSQVCQGNLPLYREAEMDFSQCDGIEALIPRVQCKDKVQSEAIKANNVIRKYNDFVRKCQRRSKSGDTTTRRSKWQEKLGDAKERNLQMEGTKSDNDARYEREVGKRMQETEKVLEQNAVESAREFQQHQETQRQRVRQVTPAKRQVTKSSVARSNRIVCPTDPTPRCDSQTGQCWCAWWENKDEFPKCNFAYWQDRNHC